MNCWFEEKHSLLEIVLILVAGLVVGIWSELWLTVHNIYRRIRKRG